MKNIVPRWFLSCFSVFRIVGYSGISLDFLNDRNTLISYIARHCIIPLMKRNDSRFNSIQEMKVTHEIQKQYSAFTLRFFQHHAGRIPFYNDDLNNYSKFKMKYDFW